MELRSANRIACYSGAGKWIINQLKDDKDEDDEDDEDDRIWIRMRDNKGSQGA